MTRPQRQQHLVLAHVDSAAELEQHLGCQVFGREVEHSDGSGERASSGEEVAERSRRTPSELDDAHAVFGHAHDRGSSLDQQASHVVELDEASARCPGSRSWR